MDEVLATYGPGAGFGAFVILVLVSVVRGDFIPRKSHEARVSDLKASLFDANKRADDWREAWLTSAEAQTVTAKALAEATELAKSSAAVINALSRIVHPEAGEP